MADNMESFSARLASFVPSRSRNIQPMAWPYDSPSPEQLAHAGFFFNPYDTNPDNTTCFLCRRALDGWEEGDNPVTEHLKHSPDCGWAILMDIQEKSSNPSEIEDPTSAAIVEARRATFAMGWPHDEPGWVCQSDKMVEAGWYFCPSDESPDLASCPYCKLSLDGWEETDNPFEEHHKRSSGCSFFVYALPAAKPNKATRSKKTRVSKASRLSTQSVMTTTSEAPTIDDDTMDISVMSQATVKKAKGTKKSTRGRTKKSKKEEPLEVDELMDPEPVEEKAPEPAKPKRATRGTKRGSEAVTQDLPPVTSTEEPELEEPSPKRRATEIRRSVSQQPEDIQPDYPEEAPIDMNTSPVMPKKGRKGAKKSTTTKTRKTSTASTSGRTTKGKAPDDSILEAAIEADLAHDMQDEEPFEFQYKDEERESARFRKQSILSSTAVPAAHDDMEEPQDTRMEPEVIEQSVHEPEAEPVPEVAEPKTKKGSKKKATSKKSKKEKVPEPEPEPEPETALETEDVELVHSKLDQSIQPEVSESQPQSVEEEEPLQEMMELDSTHKRQPESDSEDMQPPAKKQGRKTASKGRKLTTSKHAEDDLEDRSEIADTKTQTAPDAAKTRGNGSKRKAKEVDEVIDQQDNISEDLAHEEIVEKPPPKAKRGRPAKDAQEAPQAKKQVVEAKRNSILDLLTDEEDELVVEQPPVKSKRGRPTKDAVEAPQQAVEAKRNVSEEVVEQPLAKAKRGRPPTKDAEEAQQVVEEKQDEIAEDVVEQPPVKAKRGRPAKDAEEIPQVEKQVVEEKPKRGRPSKQTSQNGYLQTEEQPKQTRPSKSKVPPKNTQRYSDLPKDRHRAQSFIESVTSSPPARAQEPANPRTQERTPSPSPQSSDAENQPPSTRPRSARPPIVSPSKTLSTRVPLAASTPIKSPSKRQVDTTGYLSSSNSWKPMEIDELLGNLNDKENRDFTLNHGNLKEILTSPEKKMTVEEWIRFNAKNGEERLRQECERLIGVFEREGGKAMRALEGIECID